MSIYSNLVFKKYTLRMNKTLYSRTVWTLVIIGILFHSSLSCAQCNDERKNKIAPLEKAITLAQTRTKQGPTTLLVLSQYNKKISAVNLSKELKLYLNDPLDLVSTVGIKKILEQTIKPSRTYDVSDLVIPENLSSKQIAAGANFAEHGEEGGLSKVFLFPKYSVATPGNIDIPFIPGELLDYEIEVCLRFDRDVSSLTDFNLAKKGLFLCGDLTDRAALMRNIDPSDWESGVGYTDGKSGLGKFPIGFYTVIPFDLESFTSEIDLQLDVNGKTRQNDCLDKMQVKFNELIHLVLSNKDSHKWKYKGASIPLLNNGTIQKGQSLLSGTPSGVAFRPPSKIFIAKRFLSWITEMKFFSQPLTKYIIEEYIDHCMQGGFFLKPGDNVSFSANFLGEFDFVVTPLTKI